MAGAPRERTDPIPLGAPSTRSGHTERADAARNRRKILAAAERLVATEGFDALTMDRVAQAAGVGVGTVYRRFTDLAGLAQAMLDEKDLELQEGFLRGDPPLGPGAPPAERLHAFLDAMLTRVDHQSELMLVVENTKPLGRYRSPVYGLYHTHVASLLRDINPHADVVYLADALMAPLSADLVVHQRDDRGITVARLREQLHALTDAVLHAITDHP